MTFFLYINLLLNWLINNISVILRYVSNLIFISIFHYLIIIILFSTTLFSLLFLGIKKFTVIISPIISIITLSDRKFMKKLLLILQFSVFIYTHCSIRRGCGYHFKKWMQCYSLDKFLVTFHCLKFSLFIARYLPKYGCAI